MDFPLIGIGTYKVKPQSEINFLLENAFRCGYNMIDTAEIYRNQKYIGAYIKNFDRSKIWITSKISFANYKSDNLDEIIKSLNKTFIDLNTDYIDLYLIHCPIEEWNGKIWNLLRYYQKEGKIRYIGVSNFNYEKLTKFIREIGPEEAKNIFCNQIEYNPFLNRKDLIKLCQDNNIKVVAYGSLNKKNDLIEEIAKKLYRTPEQVLLKWGQQNGAHIIPMAQDAKYIKDNICLDFEIPEEDMKKMNELNENYSRYEKYL